MTASTPPPQDQLLPDATVEQLHQAAVNAGLASSRQALLAGIDPTFVTGLEDDAPSPAARLLSDLHALNRVKKLTDGSMPMVRWLSNAKRIAGSRIESEVFRRALEEIAPQSTTHPAVTLSQRRPFAVILAAVLAGVALASVLVYVLRPPSNDKPDPGNSVSPILAKFDPLPTTASSQSSAPTTVPSTPTATILRPVAPKPGAKAPFADTPASASSAAPPPPAPPPPPPPSGARSGTAKCASATSCTLGGGPFEPSLARVCLDAPNSAADLAGHIPVCTMERGNVCSISHPPLTKPLLPPVTWRLCSR